MIKPIRVFTEKDHGEPKDWRNHLIHPIRSYWGDGTAEWGKWKKDFDFVKDVGLTFNDIVREIISQKMSEKFTKKDKEIQLLKRGRYVEYNLLYDRGTKFGLNTGGNIDAILMSMPPNAKWK